MDTRHKGVSLVVGLLAASCGWAAALQQPTGLLCELSAEPLGIEDFTPAFSWIVNDPQLDSVQTAYQIQVHHGLGSNRSLVWDSRKTASSRSIAVPYAESSLQLRQIYTWTVRT